MSLDADGTLATFYKAQVATEIVIRDDQRCTMKIEGNCSFLHF